MKHPSPRVTLVSAGELSTCPRMVKFADALHEEGYRVRAVTSRRTDWGAKFDVELERARPWLSVTTVDTTREGGHAAFWPAAARYYAARRLTRSLGIATSGVGLRTRAWLRSGPELLEALSAEPTDFIFLCGGSFPIAPFVPRPFAIDFEDLESGQQDDSPDGRWQSELTDSIERDAAFGARFVTMGSPMIAAAYRERLGIDGIPIHNVFPLPSEPPSLELSRGPLELYWFSQTIGPGRGLEEAIREIGDSGVEAVLHLRGADGAFRDELERLARETAPRLSLVIHEPRPPWEMVECCRGLDIGLAIEQGLTPNSRFALSNKAFTYLLGGLAVVFTDTPAQRAFRNALGDRQPLGSLAQALRRWDRDRDSLLEARRDAWEWAKKRWHWEHREERGAVVRCFEQHLPKVARCA